MAQFVFRHSPLRSRPDWSRANLERWVRLRWEYLLKVARHDPRLFLWNVLWLPFWFGGEAPMPGVPLRGRHAGAPHLKDPAGAYLASRIDRVTRRFAMAWFAGAILRGFTLALLAITLWSLVAVIGFAGLPGWWPIVGLLLFGVIAGACYGWLIRPDRLMVASMLDRTFGLQERIVTAFDRPGDPGHVSRLQLADAANTFDEILEEVPRSAFMPVREAAICLVMAGALVTMLMAYVPQHGIAGVSESPVPQFVPASERLAVREQAPPRQPATDQPASDQATVAEIQERGRRSQSAREDLARIGDALQDHSLTQPAADAITSGDYAAAAESLRAASESASSMSQESRDALADDLEQAARDISETNPELAQAANDAASALREGGPDAESALDGLADQIDETGDKVESQEDLARDLDEAQSGSSDAESSGGEGSEGEQSASNQPQSSGDQQGDQGTGSDPGEGSSAQPGVSNQPQESDQGSSSSESSEGSAEQGGGESSSSEDAGQEPTDAQQGEGSGDPSASDAESGSGSASDQGLQGAPDDETSASQGSGAGTGQSGANDQNTSDQPVDDPADPAAENPDAEVPGVGEAGDPPPSREDRREEDDGTGTTTDGSSTLQLQGTSDSGVQTGGDSGSSSLGSGSGSTTASGDQSQGNVGVAGPDSNRVPDTLRDVVRDYFEEPVP